MDQLSRIAHQIFQPGRRPTFALALLSLLLVGLLLLVAPIGYIGGGADDTRYLEAARCARVHGFCLPPNHWWARWPLVLPLAGVTALLGESRLVLALLPALHAATAATLLGLLLLRVAGPVAATVGIVLLLSTQVFAEAALSINVDIVEISLLLGAATTLERGLRCGSPGATFAAGILLAIAVQSRATALAMALPFGLIALRHAPRPTRHIAWLLIGFALPLLAEMIAYALGAGDPLLSWKRALGHTSLPTTELAGAKAPSGSPLFNPAFVAAWRPAAGIDAHWTVRPLINLLAAPAIGPTFWIALLLAAFARTVSQRRLCWGLTLLAAYSVTILAYGFAIDPKPRMFLVGAAAAAAVAGLASAKLWVEGQRAVVVAPLGLLLAASIVGVSRAPDTAAVEDKAARWVWQAQPAIVDGPARRLLALVPLPADPAPHRARSRLTLEPGPCPSSVAQGRAMWPLAERLRIPHFPLARHLLPSSTTARALELCGYQPR